MATQGTKEINGSGCVYLIGAGCGKADLITVRGLRLLKGCDAIVYDDLIDDALLDEVPDGAEIIYMGKRSGRPSYRQDDITGKLIELAHRGLKVARLKGGDPFVFGRGGEEALALKSAGIPFEEVPGISSCIAIPAEAGVPVTHRGMSRGFHVVTAQDAEGGLPENFAKLCGGGSGTAVILMGLHKLRQIAETLIGSGYPADTPAAVISGGNADRKLCVRANLSGIAEKASEAGAETPAVIVIGDTAAIDVSGTIDYPLDGVRIGLTGTMAVQDKLRTIFTALGADVISLQRSVVRILKFNAMPDGKTGCMVFTSSNGVRCYFEQFKALGLDIRKLAGYSFAVIGTATGETLSEYGIRADYCPEVHTGRALGRLLAERLPDGTDIYLYRAANAGSELPDILKARFRVRDIPVYELADDTPAVCGKATYGEERSEHDAMPDINAAGRKKQESIDYICFSSGSGVKFYFERYAAVSGSARCVCIGNVTAGELKRLYGGAIITGREITAQGMAEALLEDCRKRQNKKK